MRFTEEELTVYREGKDIGHDFLDELKLISSAGKIKTERLLGTGLTDRQFFLIKEGGIAAAAWLIPGIDWQLASLATGEASYAKMIMRLAENETFLAGLFSFERQALLLMEASYKPYFRTFQTDES